MRLHGAEVAIHAEHASDATERAVLDGLRGYNQRFISLPEWEPLRVAARTAAGTLAGGVTGETAWTATGRGWLYVRLLWVGDAWRGQGIGSRLLEAAEIEAVRRGCSHAYLDTLEFQARPFYERQGYTVFGVQEGFPPGSRRYLLQKRLGPERLDEPLDCV